jgi:hypothetical protein
MIVRRIWLPLLLLSAAFLGAPAVGEPPAQDEKPTIDQLIEQLGSDAFKTREEASRKLLALGKEALPALRKAQKSSIDLETRRRAEQIADEISARLEEQALQELLRKANDVGIDRLIDLMATRKDFVRDEHWGLVYQTAQSLAGHASKLGNRNWKVPELDYKNFETVRHWAPINSTRNKILVDGFRNNVTTMDGCLVVSSGSIGYITSVANSVLFINGDMKGCTGISNCAIFCNGEVGYVTSIDNSVVLATGGFKGSTTADDNFFQVKSVGRHTTSHGNVYLNLKEIQATQSEANLFPQDAKGPLQLLKLFDPARIGVEFTLEGEQVKISKVSDGKPFARAGLRAGDVVLEADRAEVESAADFAHFLRRRAPGKAAVLKILRGDKTLEITVAFQD